MTNKNNGNVIQNSFNTMSLLELEDDSEFIEWCFLEGSERISVRRAFHLAVGQRWNGRYGFPH